MSEIETALRGRVDVDRSAVAETGQSRVATAVRRLALAAVCVLAMFYAGKGIYDEGYVSLQGDMPRHMMNGVYLTDLLRDRPFSSVDTFLEYTQLYYARYPALSLGHHPPMLPAAEVPLFTLFGPSVGAARLVLLFSLIGAAALLFLLVADRYGTVAATLSATLFVTSPLIVELSQSVLSEVLAIVLFLAAAYSLHRFWQTERRWALAAFVVAATASLYAKQLVVLGMPGLLFMSLAAVGWRRLLRRDVLLAAAAVVVVTIPLGLITVALAPSNFTFVADVMAGPRDEVHATVMAALRPQLSIPTVILAALAVLIAIARRDRRAMLFVGWIAGVVLGMYFTGLWGMSRFSVYWVPALCAMAGSLAGAWRRPWLSRLAIALLVIAIAVQARSAGAVALPKATGYEEAARFVLASDPGPTVLFAGAVDTGFFTFFVRKHDEARRLVVLRADKLLTTSYLGSSETTSRISEISQVYPILRRYGTRYVVSEDRPTRARTLEAFRHELRSDNFVERKRIRLESSDWRLNGTNLIVYEYLGATAPDPEATLAMDMPVVSRSLAVKLSDLIARKYLR